MGNYKFRLSDMMPNAWFYKLKNSSQQHPIKNKKNQYLTTTTTTSSTPPNHQTTTTTTQEPISHSRHSYYFTRELIKPDHHHHNHPIQLPNSPTNPKITDLHFPDSPRKSSRIRSKKNKTKKNKTIKSSSKIVTSSVSSGCSCRATLESVWINKSDSTPDYSASVSPDEIEFQELPDQFDSIGAGAHSWSSSCSTCRVSSSSPTEITMDTKTSSPNEECEKIDGFDAVSVLDLPPILTKPAKFSNNKKDTELSKIRKSSAKFEEKDVHGSSLSVKIVKKESIKTLKDQKVIRRSSPSSPGLKLRLNSPRIVSRRSHTKDMTSRIAQSLLGPKAKQRTPTTRCSNTVQTSSSRKTSTISSTTSLKKSRKKNLSDTFAIIKSSFDPQRDFRESMVEMIVENNIRTSRDLEELLACYLSLNSDEYHDIIVKVFEQIWFDLTETRL